MKVNLVRGFFRVWVFVSVIWLLSSWVMFGDIIKNRYPTGSQFIVDLEVTSAVLEEPLKIITKSFEFRDTGKNAFDDLIKLQNRITVEDARRNLITVLDFPNNNSLIIEATKISKFGGVPVKQPNFKLDLETLNESNLSETFSAHLKKLRQESLFPSLVKFSIVGILPQLLLLVLGGFVFWVFQGFKTKTKKD